MQPDNDVLQFIKDFLWAPLLGLIAWAWKWNQDDHKALWNATEKLRESASASQSNLNDRIMDHVDGRVTETMQLLRDEDAKLMSELNTQRGHIGKLFDKLDEHARRSEDRHIEMMQNQQTILQALHTGLATKADK